MNKVTGKILLEETGVGIPNLLVTIYDLDSNSLPKEVIQTKQMTSVANFWDQLQGDRLGSVLTSEDGIFELEYEDSEFQVDKEEKRPDLVLFVTAPEKKGTESCATVLHLSCGIRQHAGRTESYVIQLSRTQLQEAGLTLPSDSGDPQPIIAATNANVAKRTALLNYAQTFVSERAVTQRTMIEDFHKNFQPKFLESISQFPKTSPLVRPDLKIEPTDNVTEKMTLAIERSLDTVINSTEDNAHAPIKARIRITPEEADTFLSVGEITENDIYRKFSTDEENNPKGRPSFLTRENEIVNECLEATVEEKCAEYILDGDGLNQAEARNDSSINESVHLAEEDGSDLLGNGVELSTTEDVPKFIAKLFNSVKSPEEQVSFGDTGTSSRPDAEAVQNNIESLSFRIGPADTPAYYDFHNLQIAFDSVWSEVFDKNLLTATRQLYTEIMRMGGNPCAECYEETDSDPMDALRQEVQILDTVVSENNIGGVTPYLANSSNQTNKSSLWGGISDLLDELRERFEDPSASNDQDCLSSRRSSPMDLLNALEKLLDTGEYSFTTFAANSVNFGNLVTYRQKWVPINYQAGELVKTITLAPNQSINVTRRTKVNKKRSQKELEKYSSAQKDESNETTRAESEILRKVARNTNFKASANGGSKLLGGSYSTGFSRDAAKTSQDVKKNFREAVSKAANEYKQERSVEITTEEAFEFEETETSKISNENNEISVNFLFYELQRRYRVSEEIHRLTPVVLVAQSVPTPHEINEAWLVAHDWILKRVILDDSFLPAFEYLASGDAAGDKVILDVLKENLCDQRKLVNSLQQQLKSLRFYSLPEIPTIQEIQTEGLANPSKWALYMKARAAEKRYGSEWREDEDAVSMVYGEDIAERFQDMKKAEADLTQRIENEANMLNEASGKYTAAFKDYKIRRVQIARLRVHIKSNILYYMQAIWEHEPPDQRYFRLHQIEVPTFAGITKYKFSGNRIPSVSIQTNQSSQEVPMYEVEIDPNLSIRGSKPLAEIADLDNLLGFKGNYMMFPLKESNKLTDLMMAPYIDQGWQLVDPDFYGNMNRHEFSKFVCCLHEKLSSQEFEAMKEELKEMYGRLLKMPFRSGEDIILSTDSMFIEALPGSHALLEDFKLMHRAIDVKKVQAEVREMELENLRLAARLLEGERDDPDVEKKIVIEGGANVNVPVGDE